MEGFLADAIQVAQADLDVRRSSGNKSAKPLQNVVKKRPRWLDDDLLASTSKKKNRELRDLELSDYDLERSRKAMARKQREYKRMFHRGTDMSLDGDAANNLLIDFDRKWAEGHRLEDSSEEEVALASDDEEDPMIEIEDEFGRHRKIRKSEALIHEKPIIEGERPQNLIHGPHLQRFNPDEAKKDAIWAEEEASKEVHYDPSFEVRQRGVAYLNLGRGQDRVQRLDNLQDHRVETMHNRTERGLREPEPPKAVEVPVEALSYAIMREKNVRETLPNDAQRNDMKIDSQRRAERLKTGEAFLDKLW